MSLKDALTAALAKGRVTMEIQLEFNYDGWLQPELPFEDTASTPRPEDQSLADRDS